MVNYKGDMEIAKPVPHLKRYQYYTKDGIKWTDFFEWDCDDQPEWQLRGYKLRNEYKVIN